jgi:hypothetical protein
MRLILLDRVDLARAVFSVSALSRVIKLSRVLNCADAETKKDTTPEDLSTKPRERSRPKSAPRCYGFHWRSIPSER